MRTVVGLVDKYDAIAEHFSEDDYADAEQYYEHRAQLVVDHGPTLTQGETVLDIACGDGGLGRRLVELGANYRGVDASERMVEVARRDLGDRVEIGTFEYEPPAPVDVTTIFRALILVPNRLEFFRRVHSFTRKKLVFDFDPRMRDPGALETERVVRELERAGWRDIRLRPFLMPQHARLPATLQRLLFLLEPLPGSRKLTAIRFPLLVSATA